MKHQIVIIGGQITPIYWGIKEKNPDVVHLLYTKESRNHVPIIEHLFDQIKFYSYQISPYHFSEINKKVKEITFNYSEAEFELNLTGGTKVMALASQNIFNSLEFNSFYIDQKNRIYDFSSKNYTPIQSKLKLDTFIKLSGHKKYISKKLTDFSANEISFANEINQISNKRIFSEILKAANTKIANTKTREKLSILKDSYQLVWDKPYFNLTIGESNIHIESINAFKIAFNGFWWELLVAAKIRGWNKIYEQILSLELYSKSQNENIKNEIDIIINTGINLIFIECKSGIVKQEDLNKIRAVKKLYGGISSRSILVCKYKPRQDIIEKCHDLGIELFFDRNLNNLIAKLENLLLKMEL